ATSGISGWNAMAQNGMCNSNRLAVRLANLLSKFATRCSGFDPCHSFLSEEFAIRLFDVNHDLFWTGPAANRHNFRKRASRMPYANRRRLAQTMRRIAPRYPGFVTRFAEPVPKAARRVRLAVVRD